MKQLLVAVLFAAFVGSTALAQCESGGWEYAYISKTLTSIAWSSPDFGIQTYENDGIGDLVGLLADAYNVERPYASDTTTTRNAVFNMVGHAGWELVLATNVPTGELIYWFKRPC